MQADIDQVARARDVVRLLCVHVLQQAVEQVHVVRAVPAAPPVEIAGDPLVREFPEPRAGHWTKMRIGEVGKAIHGSPLLHLFPERRAYVKRCR